MTKIKHTIGVLFLTLCLFVVIYGQGDLFTVARRDALKYIADQGKKPPAWIRGMVKHSGKGNKKEPEKEKFPDVLPTAPLG